MRLAVVLPLAFTVVLLWSVGLVAQEEEEKELTPEQVKTGEVHIKMNSDYAKVEVDGVAWEEHAFEDNGRTLVIHKLDRTMEHHVRLTPVYPELGPVETVVRPADWKLVKLMKRVRMWKAEKKVVFPKVKKEKGK